MKDISVGICAYNEGSTIGHVIANVLNQALPDDVVLKEIFIVASGCTDTTEDVVTQISHRNPKVKLMSEKEKRGKASATNLILGQAGGDIIVLTDADVFPAQGSIRELVKEFRDETVGAVGGRPIPMDDDETFWGFTSHLIWTHLQNELLKSEMRQGTFFQLSGYLCAIRSQLVERIPETVIDEDKYMGEMIRRRGYEVKYTPRAVVYIRGPRSIPDFFNQRVRVLVGHLQVRAWFDLASISTSSPRRILPALVRSVDVFNPKKLAWTALAAVLEGFAHLLARHNFIKGKVPSNWLPVPTTKPDWDSSPPVCSA